MKSRIALVVLSAVVLAVPCAAATNVAAGAAPAAAPAAAAPAPAAQGAAPGGGALPAAAGAPACAAVFTLDDPLDPVALADGCSAEQLCIHQPPATVSCTGPPGATCSSSWAGCGRVTCNGVTTRCPGYCVGDHHCANFCLSTYGSFDGYCNSGCCECL